MPHDYECAIIGTGGIARRHAQYYEASDRTRVVAGCDINQTRLDQFCDEHGIEHRYVDYQELLEDVRPQIVSVSTWNNRHAEIAIAAMEAGAEAILCEKPMGDDLGGPADAVAKADETGCKLVVHHQRRYTPAFRAVQQAIADGVIGGPVHVHIRSGGGMLNMASHLIDGCRWLLGDPGWTSVVGWIQRNTKRFERGTYAEEKSHALIEFEGGHELTLSLDMVDQRKEELFRVCGPEGVLHGTRDEASVINADGERKLEMQEQPGFFEALLQWMDGGPVHRCVGSEAVVTQELIMAIYQSARTRTRLEPPYDRRQSPLVEMIEAGELPAEGEPYDIRSDEALEWAMHHGEVEAL